MNEVMYGLAWVGPILTLIALILFEDEESVWVMFWSMVLWPPVLAWVIARAIRRRLRHGTWLIGD